MFVAVDEENKQVFGPFSTEEAGTAWVRAYIRTVEGHSWDIPGVDLNSDFDVSAFLWNIHEVTYVDEDDREFGDWLGDEASLAEDRIARPAQYVPIDREDFGPEPGDHGFILNR